MYNWTNYNRKKNKLAQKLNKFNDENIFNSVEGSYYNHTRDILSLSLQSLQGKKAKILDYGSNIASISNIKNKISTKNLKFLIYNPFHIEENKKNIFKNINYKIYNNIKLINQKVDFVNFGSSLQYLPNYKEIFNEINFKKKAQILITATPFTINKSYISIQNNHQNLFQKINNYKKLVDDFNNRDFNLIFKSSISIDLASIKNLKGNTFFLNMLFEKC